MLRANKQHVSSSVSIACYLPSLHGGGAERVMVTLANAFAQADYNVDLVLAKAEGPYLSEMLPLVRIIDLKSGRVLSSLPRLVRYLKREKPTALLSVMDHANIVALWAQKIAGVSTRVVPIVQNTISIAAKRARKARGRLIPALVKQFYPWADVIVVASEGVADDLAEITGLPKSRIRVVYNPVITFSLFLKAEEPLKHPWFELDVPIILGVGRLTEQKDFPTLIEAFALLRKERSARLFILGEGEDRAMLEALVRKLGLSNDVLLPGFVKNPFPYMKRAAVFVLSSRWEGFGNVLVEAMAVGTPVVATDCPSGPREILEGGKWGRLVPVGDVEALARAIEETLDEERHPDVVRRAMDFHVDKIAGQYLEVLGLA